jgi:hypothetical protein
VNCIRVIIHKRCYFPVLTLLYYGRILLLRFGCDHNTLTLSPTVLQEAADTSAAYKLEGESGVTNSVGFKVLLLVSHNT